MIYFFYRYRRYRGWGWGIGGLAFMVILIVVICSISIRYSGGQEGSDNYYAPGDTRIVSYNPAFCQSLTLKDTSSTGATLYLLKEKPVLTGSDNFTITQQYNIQPIYEHHLYYYLHQGSDVSGTMCLISGTTSKFYLIKGTNNFNHWKDDGHSSNTLVYFDITAPCGSNRTFTYSITREDQYYFVFYNPSYSTNSVVGGTLTFNRALYQIANQNDIVDSCFAGGRSSTCTLDVPFQSNYTALIIVDSSESMDDSISIDTSCGARVWMYAVITVVPVLFVVLCIIGTVVTCTLVKRHRQKKYEPLNDPPTATAADLGTGGLATEPPPPPFNPDYGASTLSSEPPPAYASVVKN